MKCAGVWTWVVCALFCTSFFVQSIVPVSKKAAVEDPYVRWLKYAIVVDGISATVKDSAFLLNHYVRFAARSVVLAVVVPQFKNFKSVGNYRVGSIQRTLAAMAVQLVIQSHHEWYTDIKEMVQKSECVACNSSTKSKNVCAFLIRCYALGYVASMLASRQALGPILESDLQGWPLA